MHKFDRLERLIGEKNVCVLADCCVCVVGCGGVGGYVIEALVRSNIGTLILIDPDVVTLTNYNRQLIATDQTINQKKVISFQNRIASINDKCRVIIHDDKLNDENIEQLIPKTVDYVVDACDDTKAKLAMIAYCTKYHLPFISAMGTGNRIDPSQLAITTLDKTCNDPLAKVMRQKVKKSGIKQKITVCTSYEIPIKTTDTTIASCSFVPGSAGLLIASHVVDNLIKKTS